MTYSLVARRCVSAAGEVRSKERRERRAAAGAAARVAAEADVAAGPGRAVRMTANKSPAERGLEDDRDVPSAVPSSDAPRVESPSEGQKEGAVREQLSAVSRAALEAELKAKFVAERVECAAAAAAAAATEFAAERAAAAVRTTAASAAMALEVGVRPESVTLHPKLETPSPTPYTLHPKP
jgi:hypothetical protein